MSALAHGGFRPRLDVRQSHVVVGTATLSVVVLGAGAAYSPKIVLELVLAAALAGLVFWRLTWGLAAFALLTFPAHLPGSLGVGQTVAKPLGVLLALAWVATLVARRGSPRLLARDHPAITWVTTAFLILAASSVLWTADVGETRYQFGRLVQVIILFLLVYTAASKASSFRLIVWSYLVASVVTAAYSTVTNSYQQGRLSGIFDPNYFAAELIPAILIAAFLLFTAASKPVRFAAGVVFVIDLVAFALTQSRGGFAGLAVGLLAAVVLAGRARQRIVVAVLMIVAAALAYYVAFAPSHLLGGSSSGRSDEWRIAWRMFLNHPLNGVGLGNFVVLEPGYATQNFNISFVGEVVKQALVAHNTYLELAAELGLAGVVLVLAVIGLVLRTGFQALKQLSGSGDLLEFYARGLVAGAIGMFAAYVFLSAEYEKQLWLVLGLVVALSALAGNAGSRDVSRAP